MIFVLDFSHRARYTKSLFTSYILICHSMLRPQLKEVVDLQRAFLYLFSRKIRCIKNTMGLKTGF